MAPASESVWHDREKAGGQSGGEEEREQRAAWEMNRVKEAEQARDVREMEKQQQMQLLKLEQDREKERERNREREAVQMKERERERERDGGGGWRGGAAGEEQLI